MSRIIRVERPAFFADAACRGTAGQFPFFPTRNVSTQPARELCAGCPVMGECLDYAVADDSLQGIWGGTSEEQRDQIRKRARA